MVNFYLSQTQNEKARQAFLRNPIRTNELSDKVIIDKRGTNVQALHNMNIRL
ncbi:transposase [Photobacterium damselae]|uniref:transposase n=1 Tax=Photobacterium damselae TaxID=38293 RepID=UPI001E29AA0E|nr:transposase [Photobacterium damselae]